MSKKPEIFKPNMEFIDNNKKAYYSYLEETIYEDNMKELDSVQDFLDRVSLNGGYVFSKNVIIVTKDKTYETKIAGKLGNKIVTIDGESIKIEDVVKIYEKK